MNIEKINNEIIINEERTNITNIFKLLTLSFLNISLIVSSAFTYFFIKEKIDFKLPDKIILIEKQTNIGYIENNIKNKIDFLLNLNTPVLEQMYKKEYFNSYSDTIYNKYMELKKILNSSLFFEIIKFEKINGLNIPYTMYSDEKIKTNVYFSTIKKYEIILKIFDKEEYYIKILLSLDESKITDFVFYLDEKETLLNKIINKMKYIDKNNLTNYFNRQVYFSNIGLNLLKEKIEKIEKLEVEKNKQDDFIKAIYLINNEKYIFLIKYNENNNSIYIDNIVKMKNKV